MEEILITVEIAGRPYKITIERAEEEMFRKAVKVLAEKLKEYSQSFAIKDIQDSLALVALQYTSSSLKYEDQLQKQSGKLVDKLNEIDTILSENTVV